MKIITTSGLEYIPKWNGNRKLPKDEQVVIEWNYLSGSERENVYGIDFKLDEKGNLKGDYTFKVNNKELLEKSIKKITNLEVSVGETTRQATIEDICNLPEFGKLYRELVDFFTSQNGEEDKKKL